MVCGGSEWEKPRTSSPLPTEPGTRFALGTRFGRPTLVVSPAFGAAATRAAAQPSSAAEFQLPVSLPWGAGWAASPELDEPRRNQSDSRESKIGSRWSCAGLTDGGTVTELPSEPPTAEWLPPPSVEDLMSAAIPDALRALDGVKTVDVRVVWEPAWTPDRLSESARAKLSLPLEELESYRAARRAA